MEGREEVDVYDWSEETCCEHSTYCARHGRNPVIFSACDMEHGVRTVGFGHGGTAVRKEAWDVILRTTRREHEEEDGEEVDLKDLGKG